MNYVALFWEFLKITEIIIRLIGYNNENKVIKMITILDLVP